VFKIHDPWKVPENSVLEWNYSKSLTSKQKSLKKHVGNLALLILVFRECRNFTREHFEPWIQNKLMASVCWLFISTPMMLVGVWCIFLVQRLVVVSCIVCIFILVPKNSWSRNSLNCFSCRDQCNCSVLMYQGTQISCWLCHLTLLSISAREDTGSVIYNVGANL